MGQFSTTNICFTSNINSVSTEKQVRFRMVPMLPEEVEHNLKALDSSLKEIPCEKEDGSVLLLETPDLYYKR